MPSNLERLAAMARNEIRSLKATITDLERKDLRQYLFTNEIVRDIYDILTGHINSDNSINYIRLCAPVLYPAMNYPNIEVSIETWRKKIICIAYGDDTESIVRMFLSPLEILFKRATNTEKRDIIAYLTDETKRLEKFNVNDWLEVMV